MAHKKIIIWFNLDYNVCSADQQQRLWCIWESVASSWPHVEHYSGGLTLSTPDGRRPSSLCSGEFGVWLKQLTLTSQPTHLFHPVATLEFNSFLSCHFDCLGSNLQHNWQNPRSIWSRSVCLIVFECNEKFKLWALLWISEIFSFFICVLKSWILHLGFYKNTKRTQTLYKA